MVAVNVDRKRLIENGFQRFSQKCVLNFMIVSISFVPIIQEHNLTCIQKGGTHISLDWH